MLPGLPAAPAEVSGGDVDDDGGAAAEGWAIARIVGTRAGGQTRVVLPTMKGPPGRRPWQELPRSRDMPLGPVSAIAAGVGIAILAVGVKGLIRETLGDPGYILLMGAVVTAAWLGGIRAGLAAVATTFVLDSLAFEPGEHVHAR